MKTRLLVSTLLGAALVGAIAYRVCLRSDITALKTTAASASPRVTDPVEWLRSGERVAVFGRGELQRIEVLQDGDRRPTAVKEIQGEPLLSEAEVRQVRTLIHENWIPGSKDQIQEFLQRYAPDSVTDNRRWGNLAFNLALFENAMQAIESGDYFIERSHKVHHFNGKNIIRVPLYRGDEQVGVHVVFDRGKYKEVDDAEDFLHAQRRISRELAAYRFNGLSFANRESMLERRKELLAAADHTQEQRSFLRSNFPIGVRIDKNTRLMQP